MSNTPWSSYHEHPYQVKQNSNGTFSHEFQNDQHLHEDGVRASYATVFEAHDAAKRNVITKEGQYMTAIYGE